MPTTERKRSADRPDEALAIDAPIVVRALQPELDRVLRIGLRRPDAAQHVLAGAVVGIVDLLALAARAAAEVRRQQLLRPPVHQPVHGDQLDRILAVELVLVVAAEIDVPDVLLGIVERDGAYRSAERRDRDGCPPHWS